MLFGRRTSKSIMYIVSLIVSCHKSVKQPCLYSFGGVHAVHFRGCDRYRFTGIEKYS